MPAPLESVFEPGPHDRPETGWVSRQIEAMAAAWDRDERVTAAEVLERFPDLDAESAIRLIYEEACLRREAGLAVDSSEVVRRFPRWGGELRALFDCDRLLGPAGAVAFPEVGETLGPFRLLSELGRGASGRTYLASEPGLADRPVVVKVIPDDQEEHLALARLRHTHIVPLFSEHAFADRGLRGLCMPYLGGMSLDGVLSDLASVSPGRWSGKLLVELIDRKTRPTLTPAAVESPFRRGLEQATYDEAVTWVVACLADALHYAHARGIVHMDVKPSNVLIAADGQPMLLDFHLARGPIRRGDRVTDRLGGTPGWMAPEQRAAMDATAAGRPVPADVDGRADIYALGLLLREVLSPAGPRAPSRGPAAGSVGLADVLRKCLAVDPDDRYADAAALAEDLRRHLNDQPLRGVANRSPAERWRKWRRRNPGALAWAVTGLSLAVAVAAGVAVGAAAYSERVGSLQNALEDGRRYRAAGRYDEAVHALERGLKDAGALPAVGHLTQALRDEVRLAERGRVDRGLHELADLIRFRHAIDLPPGDEALALMRNCRTVWDLRGRLAPAGGPGHEPGSAERTRTDLVEVAAVLADLHVRLAPEEDAGAVRDALLVLDQAEASFGPAAAIDLRREAIEPGASAASARRPRSAWGHYDLGRDHLRGGRIAQAAGEFLRALDQRPDDFWSNFYQGLCAFRLGRNDEALAAFRTCTALAPRAAFCRYNRALVYDAVGRADEALRDYSAALELDPGLPAALLNRGILLYQQGRHGDAVADFERALRTHPDRETLGRVYYSLALAHEARGDHEAARSSATEAARHGSPEAARLLDGRR